jgi:hypothetical protein
MPEFPKHVLEVLRQPLEDENATISRVNGFNTYSANEITSLIGTTTFGLSDEGKPVTTKISPYRCQARQNL